MGEFADSISQKLQSDIEFHNLLKDLSKPGKLSSRQEIDKLVQKLELMNHEE